MGLETSFVDAGDASAVDGAIRENTRVIFVETMGNPKLNVPDIMAISSVAKKHGVALYPFFLEGVAADQSLNLADGIHPNEDAQAQLLDNVWPALRPLLQ